MKAYGMDLRQRVIQWIGKGASKAEVARRFELGQRTVYRYAAAARQGKLEPQRKSRAWRKIDPEKLRAEVKKRPDATLKELQAIFKVSHNGIWVRLRELKLTLKKTHRLSRAQ